MEVARDGEERGLRGSGAILQSSGELHGIDGENPSGGHLVAPPPSAPVAPSPSTAAPGRRFLFDLTVPSSAAATSVSTVSAAAAVATSGGMVSAAAATSGSTGSLEGARRRAHLPPLLPAARLPMPTTVAGSTACPKVSKKKRPKPPKPSSLHSNIGSSSTVCTAEVDVTVCTGEASPAVQMPPPPPPSRMVHKTKDKISKTNQLKPPSLPSIIGSSSSVATPPLAAVNNQSTVMAPAVIAPIPKPQVPPPPTLASTSKRKVPSSKPPPAKRLKSPIPSCVGSPSIRLMSLARSLSPSVTRARSLTPEVSSEEDFGQMHGSSSRGKRRQLKSKIWRDFTPIYNGDLVVGAECNHCGQIFKATRNAGTSSCRRHLLNCDGKQKLDTMMDELDSSSAADLRNWKFDQEFSRQELVKLIVAHELPFSLVEYPRFKRFVASLNPCFRLVSRTTIKSDCMAQYGEEKVALREILRKSTSRVSLTADMWTSNQTLGYLCITCHFIDEKWNLNKRVNKFALVETPHDSDTMFDAILKGLQDWHIEHKLFAISLDNASVNDSFVSALQDHLVEKHLLPCEGELFHFRCAAHVLNLIAQDGLTSISGAISNIRDSVKYVKSSQSRKQRFEALIEKVGIPPMKRPSLDVSTRWNSTYQMLETALAYKRVFKALGRVDIQYVHEPSDVEWQLAKKLCSMLKVFYDATNVVSGTKYPTSHLYFHKLWEVKKELQKEFFNSDPLIAAMVESMNQKFKKYWYLSFVNICMPVILDPRFKLSFLEYRWSECFPDISMDMVTVEDTMRRIFAAYSSEMGNSQEGANEPQTIGRSNPWSDWGNHVNAKRRQKANELDRYLEEETISVEVDFDILQYWRSYAPKYPVLARIARDLLAVPASTVASESAFSTGSRVISDYRSSLSSETVEALICLQDWIRAEDDTLAIVDDEDNG